MEIIGNTKTYGWGKLGHTSEVAKLAKLNNPQFEINNNTTYAELWMGDHESGPSVIKSSGKSLRTALEKSQKGNLDQLPYLLKVLSIRTALSIQVHPNKLQAEKLHKERPDIYKDPNHKPELAIALTPFVALCGFRQYNEIYDIIEKIPPLVHLLGKNNINGLKAGGALGLKACYSTLMKSKEDEVAKCIKDISEECNKVLIDLKLSNIFNTVNRDFPNDVGILSIFFLNVIRLEPGQAIYLSANVPHAYLFGDCIECMACSDNVIRAGLTPKYKDVNTLLEMLNYDGTSIEENIFHPNTCDNCLELFIPPVDDFAVAKFNISSSVNSYDWKNSKFGSIILCLNGERTMKTGLGDLKLVPGSIAFIPGNCAECVQFIGNQDFVAYLAMYNSF